MLNPAPDSDVVHRKSALGHHLFQIAVAQRIPQVPPHAQNDDDVLKVSPSERWWSGPAHAITLPEALETFATDPFWLSLAAASGDANGLKAREITSRQMSPDAIAEAQRLAEEWRPRTCAESALEIYKGQVAEFFQPFNEGPLQTSAKQALGFLNRIDDLIDAGVVIGEAVEDLVKTLRDVHQALTGETVVFATVGHHGILRPR